MNIRFIYALFLFVFFAEELRAQIVIPPGSQDQDTVVTAFVPAAGYASDFGFLGALAINRYRYRPGYTPYYSLTEMRIRASTKAFFDLRFGHEQMETFGWPLRSRWTLSGESHPFDNYFGKGNDSVFESSDWDDGYYNYMVRRAGFSWEGRKKVYHSKRERGRLDLTASFSVAYHRPDDDNTAFIGIDRPKGIDGGWVNKVGAGFIWENRDSEIDPGRGNRMEFSIKGAPSLLFSDYAMGSLFSDIRKYFTLPVPYVHPVLALRLSGSHTFGTVPYWELPYLGDERTLRGYPLYRFRGTSSVLYNVEVRTWVYEVPYLDFKLGVHGFHDAGRVFWNEDSLNDLFRDYHRTFGGGVASTLFTPDFILRIDAGFSKEMFRLYMNIGYMF